MKDVKTKDIEAITSYAVKMGLKVENKSTVTSKTIVVSEILSLKKFSDTEVRASLQKQLEYISVR